MLSEVDEAVLAFTLIACHLNGTVTSAILHIKVVIKKKKTFI